MQESPLHLTSSPVGHVFEGYHQRAVNKVNYHPRENNILLSGAQDSCMNIFVSPEKI